MQNTPKFTSLPLQSFLADGPKLLPSLAQDEVHVWQASLDRSTEIQAKLYGLLSEEEQVRAARFKHSRDRERYVTRQGLLRLLLSHYSGLPPIPLRFQTGTHGKPELAVEQNKIRLNFNLSHSEGLALYAFCFKRRIGIDIEAIHSEFDYSGIAAQQFTPEEAQRIAALLHSERPAAFYACWTRKEAYLKARGDGLSFGLNKFEVSITPAPPELLAVPSDPTECERWKFLSLPALDGYAAACVEEAGTHETLRLRLFELS